MQKNILRFVFVMTALLLIFSTDSWSYIKEQPGKENENAKILRASRGLFDLQKNTVSNVEFYTTNYGIFGLNVATGEGSGKWPRGSVNHYIFGGGIWFGAQKMRPDGSSKRNYVVISYNPNSGSSWLVPGRIEDQDEADPNDITKYRTYFSIDFRASDGKAIDETEGPAWPIWDASPNPYDSLKVRRYFGSYVAETADRSKAVYKKGPAFISGEDIFATFKDTDLNYYEGGASQRRKEGYPLRLQFEQTIYSWGFGDYRDFIFLAYNIINTSNDTLENCWMAPVMDVDIAKAPNTAFGAGNDRVRFYNEDTTLNMALQWTDGDRGERNSGFGYLGFDFLESPAVQIAYDKITILDTIDLEPPVQADSIISRDVFIEKEVPGYSHFVRKDSSFYDNSSQLGLRTFRNWSIDDDKKEDEDRYLYIAGNTRDGDTGPGDKRFMMATGPFHMRAKDTVRVVVGIILASTAKGGDADGTTEDVQELIRKDKFAQAVYDNNFRAPTPPDRAVITKWTPYNNGMKIEWDSTSELSIDLNEKGMDFLGYRLYRARRKDLDSFNIINIKANNINVGPFGWKQIATWDMPTPFEKSVYRSGTSEYYPDIDSLRIIGPYTDASGNVIDTMAIRVMRICKGCVLLSDKDVATYTTQAGVPAEIRNKYIPVIYTIDTSIARKPWGKFFASMVDEDPALTNGVPFYYSNNSRHKILDSAFVGVVFFNKALVKYNPLFYRPITIPVTAEYLNAQVPADGIVYKKLDNDALTGTVDTVFFKNSFRTAEINGVTTTIIDILVPRAKDVIMTDKAHVISTLNDLYNKIQNGLTTTDFPDIEQSIKVRSEVIVPYMKEITNNRSFVDIGDDNGDGVITYDANPSYTEKLLNNVEYYYKLLAFDEGDYIQPTPLKINDGSIGLPNVAETYPNSTRAGKKSTFEIISYDTNKIGGLYNFEFFAIDQDRVNQEFAGDTLELEFQPYWNQSDIGFLGRPETARKNYGLYISEMKLTNISKKQILMDTYTRFEVQPCYIESLRELFTENSFTYVLSDTAIVDSARNQIITFGERNNKEIRTRTGNFTTGDFNDDFFCYTSSMNPPAYGTMGLNFNYTIQQYGGNYRPDSTTVFDAKSKYNVTAVTPVTFIDGEGADIIQTTSAVNTNTYRQAYDETGTGLVRYGSSKFASFNNGPGNYELEFLPGGEETIEVVYGKKGAEQTSRFKVKYLTARIFNTIEYNRPAPELANVDSVKVKYPNEITFMKIDSGSVMGGEMINYPDPRTLDGQGIEPSTFIGKYNLHSFGWVNARYAKSINLSNSIARPVFMPNTNSIIGTQGRYYLTAISENNNSEGKKDTLDFVNIVNIAGVQFVMDYANKGRRTVKGVSEWPANTTNYVWGEDFKAGDKIVLKTFGGALGFPLPGAKIRVKVTESESSSMKYTDKMLDQIKVVPNPYYISHQGQKSAYDAKLYFTKLPRKCKIDIYTITGDLIQTVDHDELNSESTDRVSVEIWDLLSKNGQRISSQSLIAVITTPDGAQTTKNFSVIVGGFRLIDED